MEIWYYGNGVIGSTVNKSFGNGEKGKVKGESGVVFCIATVYYKRAFAGEHDAGLNILLTGQ